MGNQHGELGFGFWGEDLGFKKRGGMGCNDSWSTTN
jgi:hypothetical protein